MTMGMDDGTGQPDRGFYDETGLGMPQPEYEPETGAPKLRKMGVLGTAAAMLVLGAYCVGSAVLGGGSKAAPQGQHATLECRVDKVTEVSETDWHVFGINRKGETVGLAIKADCVRAGKQTFLVTGDPNNSFKLPDGLKVEPDKVYIFRYNEGGYMPKTLTGNPKPAEAANLR